MTSEPELVGSNDPRWAIITGRQRYYWTQRGYLQAHNPNPGPGGVQRWPVGELAVAARIVELCKAGYALAPAARMARAEAPRPSRRRRAVAR